MYAQLGQQPLVRTTADVTGTETRDSLLFERAAPFCRLEQTLNSELWTGTQPQVVSMFLIIIPFLYSKRTAVTRSLEKRTFCGHFEHTSRGTTQILYRYPGRSVFINKVLAAHNTSD
jgi:hypothetical protein